MPELPEVETIKRGLAKTMKKARLCKIELRRANLRYPFPPKFATKHNGTIIADIRRRAKYILIDLDKDQTILIHLGMSGNMGVGDNLHNKHNHVLFHLKTAKGKKQTIFYNDPRRFGFMGQGKTSELNNHKFLQNLGVEPLGKKLTPNYLQQQFANKNISIKAALLSQNIIAGLGNIYVCEALWRSAIHPQTQAQNISNKKLLQKLCKHIQDILKEAIKAGGSTLKDHKNVEGKAGYFQHNFSVYDRYDKSCLKKSCKGTINRITQNGRSTFFCPVCQKK